MNKPTKAKPKPIKKNSKPLKREPMSDSQINTAVHQMLKRHTSQLSEFVDSIQIVATKLNPDGSTASFAVGSGDITARIQMMTAFLDRSE